MNDKTTPKPEIDFESFRGHGSQAHSDRDAGLRAQETEKWAGKVVSTAYTPATQAEQEEIRRVFGGEARLVGSHRPRRPGFQAGRAFQAARQAEPLGNGFSDTDDVAHENAVLHTPGARTVAKRGA